MISGARISGGVVAIAGALSAGFLFMACLLDASGTAQNQATSGSASAGGAPGMSSSDAGGTSSATATTTGAGGASATGTSCAAILQGDPDAMSGVYPLDPDGDGPEPPFSAYCEMDAGQDGGGWTLALKVDGNKQTFAYDAPMWLNTTPFQEGFPDLDDNEAKLDTFSKVSFSEVRLGMIDTGQARWIVLPIAGASLAAMLNGGNHTPTSLGRDVWKGLVGSPSLQLYCDMEGFNVVPSLDGRSVRIGIMSNDQTDCGSVDSFIGFGGKKVSESVSVACGNWVGCCSGEDGYRDTHTFGYVMVR
jgi:hypothetical protein